MLLGMIGVGSIILQTDNRLKSEGLAVGGGSRQATTNKHKRSQGCLTTYRSKTPPRRYLLQ